MIQLNDILREHYAHVAHLPFFPEIAGFMSSRPVLAMILEEKMWFREVTLSVPPIRPLHPKVPFVEI